MYDARYTEEQEAKYQAALSGLNVKGVVLDVGCGTGLFFRYAAPKANVVGVDVSKKLLLQAKERAKKLGKSDVVQADADHLPFGDGGFDTVFAFTVLQNMPKYLETLRELHRAARQDAFIVVTGLKKAFSKETLGKLLGEAGFNVVSMKNHEKLKCYIAIARKNA
jgi:ubiquinone/menaquinone biosynthesis C-methylase UbiE